MNEMHDKYGPQGFAVLGVNLDEEAAQLIRFQRAYQAAARGITALDDLLTTVIDRMGRVGL